MNWLSQNLIWIVLGVVVVAMLFRSRAGQRHHHGDFAGATQGESGGTSDPVTGNKVDPAHAITANYEGKTFYFESENSRAVFQQNPSRFVQEHHRHHGGCC
ncbi:YHS domain-containing protein [Ralstonia holmesii]|nr:MULTISPECIES: YHS domain-containing protein [Ralstonia]CAJ0684105.1 hypothetical protein R11007_00242 [Ralstonia sp. LMG 32967]